jgi:hypothetical protein
MENINFSLLESISGWMFGILFLIVAIRLYQLRTTYLEIISKYKYYIEKTSAHSDSFIVINMVTVKLYYDELVIPLIKAVLDFHGKIFIFSPNLAVKYSIRLLSYFSFAEVHNKKINTYLEEITTAKDFLIFWGVLEGFENDPNVKKVLKGLICADTTYHIENWKAPATK